MKRTHHLLVVTPYFSGHGGGIEAVAWQLIRHLSAQNPWLRIKWMASDCDAPPSSLPNVRFESARSWNGIEGKTGLPVPLWGAGAMLRLWRAIRRSDAVHFHDVAYSCSVLVALFCSWQGKPYFVTQHTGFVPHPAPWMRALRSWVNRVPGRWMLRRANAVVFISDEVRRDFAPLLEKQKLRLIPNGVDTGVFCDASEEQRASERRALCNELGFDESRPLLLFVGRFVERKGVMLVAELCRRFPECNWIFAGSGPLDPGALLGENGRVVRGRSGQSLAPLYRAADTLLLPAYGEGFPLVVQEALACGTAVLVEQHIGDAAPRAREWMNLESLGQNNEDRWSIKLRAMLDKQSQNASAENRRRHERAQWAGDKWNWEKCAGSYLEVFDEVWGNRAR